MRNFKWPSPCKDVDNARFTEVPLNILSDQVLIKYQCFFKLIIYIRGFLQKWLAHFFANIGSNRKIHRNKVFSSQKNECTFVILDLIKVSIASVQIGHCLFSIEVHLKLHLQPWPLKGLITKNAMTKQMSHGFCI